MAHLLLKDLQNHTCQYMGFVREDADILLASNVFEMLSAEMEVQIETLDRGYSTEELEKLGWKHDQSLYEKLLMKYTAITNKVLKRWC